MSGDQPLIVRVIHQYHKDWEPPKDTKREWVQCLCPFHDDTRPSASVSFTNDAFVCFTCGVKGDALSILMEREEMSYTEAIEYAESLLGGSYGEVRKQPKRKPGRRVFGQSASTERSPKEVPPGVRGRTPPWS